MKPTERAEKLFDEAEKLGLDAPTESMVADAINDAEGGARIMIEQEITELKIFLWDSEQYFDMDYSCGMGIAVAENEDEARRLIIKRNSGIIPYGLTEDPQVFEIQKCAFINHGGG